MAATMKNAGVSILATPTILYTVPAATTGILVDFKIANKHATVDRIITVTWTDTSAAITYTIIKNVTIPAGDTFIVDGKLFLEATDTVEVVSDIGTDVEATLAITELT